MSKGIFITATGTDIGKTYVTGLIAKALHDNGKNVGYYKAALSGAEYIDNVLMPGDAHHVITVSGIQQDINTAVSYVYKNAVSPHLAAKIEGNPVELEVVKADFKKACKKYDYVTVEGSGGIICPIRWDEKKILMEDIIKTLGLSTLIVADAGLGTINSVVLTVEYMRSKNININGIILNNYRGTVMQKDNVKMIEEITNIPILACVGKNAESIDDLSKYFEEV